MSRALLKKLFLFLSIAMVATLVLAACGDDDDSEDAGTGGDTSTTTTTSTMTTTGTTASGETMDVTAVQMMDTMKFDPDAITVAAGEEVTIDLANAGALEHNFSVDEADVDQTLNGSESEEFTFTAPDEAGEYEIYCDIPGHKEAGMVAKLIVE